MKPCKNCIYGRATPGFSDITQCAHEDNSVWSIGNKQVRAHTQSANPHDDCPLHEKAWFGGRFMSHVVPVCAFLAISGYMMYLGFGLLSPFISLVAVMVIAFLGKLLDMPGDRSK